MARVYTVASNTPLGTVPAAPNPSTGSISGAADTLEIFRLAPFGTYNVNPTWAANNAPEALFFYTDSGVPGTYGETADYVLQCGQVTTGDGDIVLKARIHRCNSTGVIQQSSGAAATFDYNGSGDTALTENTNDPVLSATEAARVGCIFKWTALDLGTWGATDRLAIELEYDNTTHATSSLVIDMSYMGVLAGYSHKKQNPSS